MVDSRQYSAATWIVLVQKYQKRRLFRFHRGMEEIAESSRIMKAFTPSNRRSAGGISRDERIAWKRLGDHRRGNEIIANLYHILIIIISVGPVSLTRSVRQMESRLPGTGIKAAPNDSSQRVQTSNEIKDVLILNPPSFKNRVISPLLS